MPKKNPGKAARPRVHRAPRTTAAIPVESAAPTVATAAALSASRPSTTASSFGSRTPAPPRLPRARPTGLTMINDYSYVGADLRRIAVLAAGAFAILIGLTFVVH